MTHSRSISLPSRPHPSAADVEEQLCRLRSSDETSTSSLCNKLSGLKDLYECVDDFLQLPMRHSSNSEEALAASIRLLDLYNLTKEAFSQMRASVQDLESSLRRREADVSSKIGSYLICMKKVNKLVSKSLATFKKSQNKKCNETSATVSLLREVEEVSIMMFESLFSSIFPAKETSKQNRWSLVFKSKQSKLVHDVSERQMDFEAIYKQKINLQSDFSIIQGAQKCLMALDKNMQQCEEDLECLYRSLIKTRVSILNVINQ
ncbi:hypothetical protein DCAR_0519162 [Daucus carota subsp. sativus]|uniref:Uncharacterized protein n=1 Tax=Daucus carota subsp. sativus TaxID=79200 RepID=A0AAF0X3K0_DAUCS|nr:PREDICTED: uncharacterized protein LOC108221255 [Daucus carota subsp. sativus]WOG99806.1 hypothetical protein DCAR_0519162 [Daucus carota subsp. sativus]